MKSRKHTKLAQIASGLLSLGLALGIASAEAQTPVVAAPLVCQGEAVEEVAYADEMSPFIEFDVNKTIARLPAGYQSEAYEIQQKMNQLYDKGDSVEFADTEASEIINLEERFQTLLDDAGVDPVFYNRLDKLSSEDRHKASQLWCETLKLMSQQEAMIEKNMLAIEKLVRKTY